MRTFSRLIGRIGLVGAGVGAGLVVAAGGGVAAIHYSQVGADHSISAQPAAVVDDRGGSRSNGSDDALRATATPSTSASREPEPGDDSRSRAQSTAQSTTSATRGNGTPDDGAHKESGRTPAPGDDHGKDGAR